MHLSASWYLPLTLTGVGAAVVAAVAVVVRREVAELQKSMRPLRVPSRRRRPPQ